MDRAQSTKKNVAARRERAEALFMYLDAYLTINGKMPTQEAVQRDLNMSNRAVRYYVEDLVAAGRLTRSGRWDSIRVATTKES